jgi:hypothetical protein
VAFWTGAVALGLTCLIGLQTIWLRMALVRRQRREQAFLDRWRPALMTYLVDPQTQLPTRLPRRDHIYFLKLWNHLQESLRGEATASLNSMAYALGWPYRPRKPTAPVRSTPCARWSRSTPSAPPPSSPA